MAGFSTPTAVVTKLSELTIDADKDWQGKGISNIGTVIVTDGAGHYFELPSLTTVQRDALTPSTGMTIWNSDNTQVERYNGAAWAAVGIAGVTIRQNSGDNVGTRPRLNLHKGAGIEIATVDDPSDDEIDITITERFKDKFFTLFPEDAALHSTSGAVRVTVDGTNFSYVTLDFDQSTEKVAAWEHFLSPNYLDENVIVKIFWKTSVNTGNCKWGVRVGGREEDEAWDAALGTEKYVTTAAPTTIGDMAVSEFAPIIPGWSASDVVIIKLARKAADGEDTLAADVQVLKVLVQYTAKVPLAQSFYPIAREAVVSSNLLVWTDVDVSAYVPVGATGVILECKGSAGASVGLRKKGSTDDVYKEVGVDEHFWAMVGVDDNRIFQCKAGGMWVYLTGYTGEGVTYLLNEQDISLGVTGSWEDILCSSYCPNAIGIIVHVVNSVAYSRDWGLRKYGSTDNFVETSEVNRHCWAVIGCDEVQKIQGYLKTLADIKFYIQGYITSGAQFYTNAHDESLATIDTLLDLPEDLHEQAIMGIIEVTRVSPSGASFLLQKKGTGESEHYWKANDHVWAIIECDTDGKIQGKIQSLDVDFKLVGFGTKV